MFYVEKLFNFSLHADTFSKTHFSIFYFPQLRKCRWWIWRVCRRIRRFAPSSPIKPKVREVQKMYLRSSVKLFLLHAIHTLPWISWLVCSFAGRLSKGVWHARDPPDLSLDIICAWRGCFCGERELQCPSWRRLLPFSMFSEEHFASQPNSSERLHRQARYRSLLRQLETKSLSMILG
jgi:hypothetical protein